MNNTWRVLLVKFIMTLAIAIIAFSILDVNPFGWVLLVALVVTAVNYLVGDLYILPNYNNIAASIADGIMGGLLAVIVGLLTPAFAPGTGALIAFAVLTGIGEYIFHPYMMENTNVSPEQGGHQEGEEGNQ